ncbi:unnamed protein product [Rotaria socialis]|uniref:Uncharacterized protein n=3 Tax=Rotaria socialis TaxID=392032 RepID=A0A820U6S4_9BILA|nr:unnamed protein product [Rotaria socialis]CAF3432157.1 unnamed protein product [Rotaria socialis]CAF3480609.1 unnamed protein product [Rotaria socialis]CAF4297498.1 unnamed protein product [Rotaria socialis]CAF4481987.1 unnamed protein product [Rotaria socialis]
MSTTTYQNNHTSTSFSRRNVKRSPTVIETNNIRSNIPLKDGHSINPTPPKRESLPRNSTDAKLSFIVEDSARSMSRDRPNACERASTQPTRQTYTHSNPPRELQRDKKLVQNNRLHQRISSAPDETSYREFPSSKSTKKKTSSANVALASRSHHDGDDDDYDKKNTHSIRSNYVLKRNEQQIESLKDRLKEQEKFKVPELVQEQRSAILLCHDLSPRSMQTSSPISANNPVEIRGSPIIRSNNSNGSSPADTKVLNSLRSSQSSDNVEADMVDSFQLLAVLAEMNLQNECSPGEVSTQTQSTSTFDASRYEYVAPSLIETGTFKLSPRTINVAKELAAKKDIRKNYLLEMRSSANARIPKLLTTIVSDNNNTMGGTSTDAESCLSFKLNSTGMIKKQTSIDEYDEPLQPMINNDSMHLCYDATLERFYDPKMGIYYDLI